MVHRQVGVVQPAGSAHGGWKRIFEAEGSTASSSGVADACASPTRQAQCRNLKVGIIAGACLLLAAMYLPLLHQPRKVFQVFAAQSPTADYGGSDGSLSGGQEHRV